MSQEPNTGEPSSSELSRDASLSFRLPFGYCRAHRVGSITQFSECLAPTEVHCAYRLRFGEAFFCRHERHREIAAHSNPTVR